MGPDDIEFVGSEESAAGTAPHEPRSVARLLRVALIVVVAAGGVAWAVTRSSGQGHDPVAASPTPSSSAASARPALTSPPPDDDRDTDIGKAVAQYLPRATVTSISFEYSVEDSTGQPTMSDVLIEAHQDSVEILVRVKPYRRPEPEPSTAITSTPPGLGSALFQFETGAAVVDVQWIGTDATPPPTDALSALAEDPRLDVVG